MIPKTLSPNDPAFLCPCGACQPFTQRPGINPRLVRKLQQMQATILEAELVFKLDVTSGYRCSEHNKAVGGTPLSMHLAGDAVDLGTNGDASIAYAIVDAAMIWNVSFIEVCPRHVHIDIRSLDHPKLIIGTKG